MTLLPEVHDQLRATARRRSASTTPQGRTKSRLRPTAGSIALAASILLVGTVVGVFLLYAHHGASGTQSAAGPATPTPPRAWLRLRNDALTQTLRRDAGCRARRLTGPDPLRYGAPDRELASELAVLRKPAAGTERVSRQQLRHLTGARIARGIYIRYARRGQSSGITYYLIPAANVNQDHAVPARCYREQLAAFRHGTARLPAAQRAAAISYETKSLQTTQELARHPAGVCLLYAGGGGSGSAGCTTVASLRLLTGTGAGSEGNDTATITPVIAPNRVATITAHYGSQRYPGQVPHPVTVTHQVSGNVVIFYLHGAWDPPSLTYRSADGTVLWTSHHR
jgi:hypothetical protein